MLDEDDEAVVLEALLVVFAGGLAMALLELVLIVLLALEPEPPQPATIVAQATAASSGQLMPRCMVNPLVGRWASLKSSPRRC
jgi:hypothetical protein